MYISPRKGDVDGELRAARHMRKTFHVFRTDLFLYPNPCPLGGLSGLRSKRCIRPEQNIFSYLGIVRVLGEDLVAYIDSLHESDSNRRAGVAEGRYGEMWLRVGQAK